MRFILLLLLGVALAGCLTDAPDSDDGSANDGVNQGFSLNFREPVDLGSKAGPMNLGVGAVGTNCQDSLDDGDCGLGEPSVEVDGAGTIYVSGVCCLTVAPPVLVSRDGGETFQEMDGDTIRQAFGIEGDFAIDEVGRMYFADIEFAATFQVTVWDADGNYLHHTKWPAPPLVDRDWIRAEGDGIVYYVYNTGAMGTRVYKSVDAGVTWTPDAVYVAPYALGNVAINPGEELCLFGGELEGQWRIDCSQDGGATWDVQPTGLPRTGPDAYPVGAYDEAGNLWLASTQSQEGGGTNIGVTMRSPDGSWTDVEYLLAGDGFHRMPWLAAGSDGSVGIAWYGKQGTDTDDGEWFLYAAATSKGQPWEVVRADADPIFMGELGRDLLDFLQVDIGPEGSLHIAYSDLWVDGARPGPDGNEEQLRYVRSEPSAQLKMNEFWLGPY